MKINFDIYTAELKQDRNVRIHHVEINDSDLLDLAERLFLDNPPVEFELQKRYIDKIVIENINI